MSQNEGYHFRGPNNKDCSILGSILGSLYFGKLPNDDEGKIFGQSLHNGLFTGPKQQ